jgi:hypothetical protein
MNAASLRRAASWAIGDTSVVGGHIEGCAEEKFPWEWNGGLPPLSKPQHAAALIPALIEH